MSNDEYLKSIIYKYKLSEGISYSEEINYLYIIKNEIMNWGKSYINEIKLSGSRAKGTAINISSDFDLFVSIKHDCLFSLEDLYNSLYSYLNKKFDCRKQNVSIGINYNGKSIDVVPGKKQSNYWNENDHSLWKNKKNTWTKTNIDLHIKKIIESKRVEEIVATKIWVKQHKLDFPSIYLELSVLNALYYKPFDQIATNFSTVLKYLRDEFIHKMIIDPANSNNVISDDLFVYEKQAIVNQATQSMNVSYWSQVIN